MQNNKEAQQWVMETPGLFFSVKSTRKNVLFIEHSYYKRARRQNDVLSEITNQ